jgi:hypothetical protein
MSRQITDLKGMTEILPFSEHQLYKLIHRQDYPLPHKKIGKRILFDVAKVHRWFDGLPGKEGDIF